MQNVLFVGAGEIGTAIARVIGDRARVEMWDKNQERAPKMRSLEESAPDASVVFICVPSWVVRELLARIAPLLRPDAVVVSLAKGIEEKTLKTMDAVLQDSFPAERRFGILGGPLLAEELMADLPGVGVFASKSQEAFDVIAPLFVDSCVRLEFSDDPHSIALASVLKNVYAVGLGVADGLGWGWNGKGWLAARAIGEMTEILAHLGGQSDVASGSAGAGDFLGTAMSPDSRNRQTGREIAKNWTCAVQSEGCLSIPSVLALLQDDVSRFPFLLSLDRIINKHEDSKAVFQDLFAAR